MASFRKPDDLLDAYKNGLPGTRWEEHMFEYLMENSKPSVCPGALQDCETRDSASVSASQRATF